MKDIYITGHRNPDLDSICSAYGYAELKKRIDPANNYHAVRCGHLSEGVEKQFALLGIEPPPYMKDVKPKVGDVMLEPNETVEAGAPIYNLVKAYNESHPSAFPVYDNGSFIGLLSIDDITSWFLKDNAEEIPHYDFLVKNIESVIPGKIIKRGKESFSATILAGAAAYEEFCSFVDGRKDSIVVLGHRKRYIEYAMATGVAAIIITTSATCDDIDFSDYEGTVYLTELGTAEVERRLRMTPAVSSIMGKQGRRLNVNDFFDDAKDDLASSNLRGLAVFDEDRFVGFVTRRCFLRKPSYEVILVDHNEVGQSIRGIEDATVIEIIDHHRLDALKTSLPIFIDAEPLGSTCTIVYQQYLRHNIVPDETTARVLLTGIMSDTLVLRSPTTTQVDKTAAGALAAISGEYDINAFGKRLFSVIDSLASREPMSAIGGDFKSYSQNGVKFGIGQCEVTTLSDISIYKDKYLEALNTIRDNRGFDWAMLMITDVLKEESILLTTDIKYRRRFMWNEISPCVYDMPGILSRKKQLLPEVIHSVE